MEDSQASEWQMDGTTGAILPPTFLFQFQLTAQQVARPPRTLKELLHLDDQFGLSFPGEIDGRVPFASVKIAWHETGLCVGYEVTGKTTPLNFDPKSPLESDGLQIWIDTRNTQSVHRASRYCHHFCLNPGSGKSRSKPTVTQFAIARAREDAPLADLAKVKLAAETTQSGYRFVAWIPAEALQGFEPESIPQLGFFYAVQDAELGQQLLTVDEEFPYTHDPSVWSTLDLVVNSMRK